MCVVMYCTSTHPSLLHASRHHLFLPPLSVVMSERQWRMDNTVRPRPDPGHAASATLTQIRLSVGLEAVQNCEKVFLISILNPKYE